jgi:imidazolonepropionase-like amidohydrolase
LLTAVRDAIAAGTSLGPRMFLAGLVDGEAPDAFGVVTASTPEQGRAIVDRYHAAGFDQMKLYSLLQPPVVEAIVSRAHELQMRVTGHVPTALGITRAVEAGMDHVAHMPVGGDPDSPEVRAVVQLLARHQTVVDPTVPWNELLGRAPQTNVGSFEPAFRFMPPPLTFNYESVTNQVDAPTAKARLTRQLAIVKALHDAGVPIVAGTDGGIPGYSVLRSIELYVEAGLTAMQALESATSVAAKAMQADADTGTIEVGKRADIVILQANPLIDISNIRSTRWVIAGGRMYESAALLRAAGFRQRD